eukprot:GHVQ01002441.1.p1 GENE.GHVQ01002441.1~~GHVQ01002441.1.p1  ORF type:complete len:230 (-),score=44.68 GHVQ01002441.1:622-1311(-)
MVCCLFLLLLAHQLAMTCVLHVVCILYCTVVRFLPPFGCRVVCVVKCVVAVTVQQCSVYDYIRITRLEFTTTNTTCSCHIPANTSSPPYATTITVILLFSPFTYSTFTIATATSPPTSTTYANTATTDPHCTGITATSAHRGPRTSSTIPSLPATVFCCYTTIQPTYKNQCPTDSTLLPPHTCTTGGIQTEVVKEPQRTRDRRRGGSLCGCGVFEDEGQRIGGGGGVIE